MRFNIGSLEVGNNLPCALIGEVSNNHNHDLPRALKLLLAMKQAGASAGKLQCYTPDELVAIRGNGKAPEPWGSDGWTMHDLYSKAMTPRDWFPALFDYAEYIGLPLFSSVFGLESLELLESLNCPAYKVSSFERDQAPLRKAVQETGKPWIVSRPDYAEPNVPTLFCPAGYPQDKPDVSKIHRQGFFGFSYHGTDWVTAASSVVFGAQMIEVHFQLADEPSELESQVSLNEHQFARMARAVNRYHLRGAL